MADNGGWFQWPIPIIRNNPLLRLNFTSLLNNGDDEMLDDTPTITHPGNVDSLMLIYANLNFGRSPEKHRKDKKAMRRMGAKVIPTVEDESTPNREWIWVNNVVPHGPLMRMPAYKSKHGAEIGNRDIVWRNRIRLAGLEFPISVAAIHAPHPRMGDAIYRDFAQQLHKAIEEMHEDFLIFGDWNKRIGEDPCNLNGLYPNGEWKGERIDGVFCSRRLAKRTRVRAIPQPKRHDNHPWIQAIVTPK